MIRKRERLLYQCTVIVVLQCGATADRTLCERDFIVSQTPCKRLWWFLFLKREIERES